MTKISIKFRMSIGISTIIPSLIFHGTGCQRTLEAHLKEDVSFWTRNWGRGCALLDPAGPDQWSEGLDWIEKNSI